MFSRAFRSSRTLCIFCLQGGVAICGTGSNYRMEICEKMVIISLLQGSMLFDTKGRLKVSEMTFASPHKSRLRIVVIYIKARSGGPDEMIAWRGQSYANYSD